MGPTGRLGPTGYNGLRGFPGTPYFQASVQIFNSGDAVNFPGSSNTSGNTYGTVGGGGGDTGGTSDRGPAVIPYALTNAVPALSGTGSTTITGLSATTSNAVTTITLPTGRYYISGAASVGSNIQVFCQNGATSLTLQGGPKTRLDFCNVGSATQGLVGMESIDINTAYVSGIVSGPGDYTLNAYIRKGTVINGQPQVFTPAYAQSSYATGAPSASPPNVTVTIMKIA